jgi:hypothetical protein
MPATTPIYAFPYPCPGDVISSAAFANLASTIDTKLLDVQADQNAALNRPNAVRNSAANTATAGVLHVTTGANSSFTITAAGVWLVSAFVSNIVSGAAVVNEYRIRLRQNTTIRFGATRDFLASGVQTVAHGPMLCAVGDVIDTDFIYTGTLTVDYNVTLNLKMIIRTA